MCRCFPLWLKTTFHVILGDRENYTFDSIYIEKLGTLKGK